MISANSQPPLRHVTIARNDSIYEAFPDICLLPSGKLLCLYREADVHVASMSRVVLAESDDRGRTWTNFTLQALLSG